MHELRTYYNLSEANELVPRLEYLFSELARIQERVNTLSRTAKRSSDFSTLHADERVRTLSEEYLRRLHEIGELGVVVEDADHGIVRFYSWFGGEEICLSWQYGEPEVRHWHCVTEPAAARRSLVQLQKNLKKHRRLH